MYDLVMLFTAHRTYRYRVGENGEYVPPPPDERRLYRCYQRAARMMQKVDWDPLFRHISNAKSVKRHVHLLFVSIALLCMYTYRIEYKQVYRRFCREIPRVSATKNMQNSLTC